MRRDGEPIENPAPPRCEATPCGSREGRPRFEEWQLEVVKLWQRCRTYRALPRGGGVADQDQWTMDVFGALDGLQARIEAKEIERLREEAKR